MKSWRIASWKGIELHIHPAVVLFLVYAAITSHFPYAVITMVSVFLHECAHAVVAMIFGQRMLMIDLTPLGAVMRVRAGEELSGFRRTLVLIAGPAATWALCCISSLLLQTGCISYELCRVLFASNLAILMINLIPAYPLDGGRLLSLLLEQILPLRLTHRIMRCIGVILGLCLIGANLYCSWTMGGWNLSLALAGCCLIYSAQAETTTWAMTELRSFMDRKICLETKRRMPGAFSVVLDTVRVNELVRRLPPGKIQVFVCVETGTMTPMGWLTESEVIQAYLQTPDTTIGQALKMSHKRVLSSKYDTN